MYSGKTTVGRKIARKLNFDFRDIDNAFEEKYKISVVDFFMKYGETLFRKIEHDLLIELLSLEKTIISTGGGTPCYYNNMEIINKNGFSLYLKMSIKSIISRMNQSKKRRPVLEQLKNGSVEGFVTNQLLEREKYYNQANQVVKAESADINHIINLISDRFLLK